MRVRSGCVGHDCPLDPDRPGGGEIEEEGEHLHLGAVGEFKMCAHLVVHSWSTQPQLTPTLGIEHNNRPCRRGPVASLSAVASSCHSWEQRGLENRRRFTPTVGSNPTPSATFGVLSSLDSPPVVHEWSMNWATMIRVFTSFGRLVR